MRWLLCLGVGLTVVSRAHAQPGPARSGSLGADEAEYVDDDDTRVLEFAVNGNVALPGATSVGAQALVDIVSTASAAIRNAAKVDVVSSATVRLNKEHVELSAFGSWYITPDVELGLSGTRSWEGDYNSYAPAATLGVDLAQRNTHLGIGYGFAWDEILKTRVPEYQQFLLTHSALASITQLLDKKTLIGATYSFQADDGWQANPYRIVILTSGSWLPENHPLLRLRHAVTFEGLRYLDEGFALAASYRIYRDDWKISASTVTTELRYEADRQWDFRFRLRGYYQSAAEFWREHYDAPAEYVSNDVKLSSFWDVGGGIKAAWHSRNLLVHFGLDATYYRFLNFPLLDSRLAFFAEIGEQFNW